MKLIAKGTSMAALLGITFASDAAWAQSYQFELSAGYSRNDTTFEGRSLDSDVVLLGGTYYLRPVDSSTGPLTEAAFLNVAASVGLTYSQTRFDSINGFSFADTNTFGFDARFVTSQNLIIEAGFFQSDSDDDPDNDTEILLGVGTYLDDRTDIVGRVSREDDGDDSEFTSVGVTARRVIEGSTPQTYTTLEGGIGLIDDEQDTGFELAIGGTYYPSRQFGLGANLELFDIGDSDGNTIELNAEYFFTQSIAGQAGFIRDDSGSIDIDSILFGLAARF